MRQVLLPVAGLLVGLAVGGQVADRPPDRMPDPSPNKPAPKTPDGPKIVKTPRVEVVGPDGNVVLVLTSEAGVPVALVSDNGIARRIDLVKVARLVK